jgi:hypothetical protein
MQTYSEGDWINFNFTCKPNKVGVIYHIDRTAGYLIHNVDCGGVKETVFHHNINRIEGELELP